MKKMILNPNEKTVNAIKNRLAITNNQCPCIAPYLQSEDTVCPCKAYREEQYCCCNLYVEEPKEEIKPNTVEWLVESIKQIIIEAEKVGLTQEDLQNAVDKILKMDNELEELKNDK